MEAELRRLRRIISWLGLLVIALLIGIVAYFSAQLRHVREVVTIAQTQVKQPLEGVPGRDGENGKDGLSIIGPQGVPGVRGIPGENSVSTQNTTVVKEPVVIQQALPVVGPVGPPGEKGEPGAPSKELQLGKLDGQIVFRYAGDTIWQAVEEVAP